MTIVATMIPIFPRILYLPTFSRLFGFFCWAARAGPDPGSGPIWAIRFFPAQAVLSQAWPGLKAGSRCFSAQKVTGPGGGFEVSMRNFPCGIFLAKAASCRNLVSDAKRHFGMAKSWLLHKMKGTHGLGSSAPADLAT